MNHKPETVAAISRPAHLAISAGCTALSGVATGLEAGLLERSPAVGIYLGLYDVPIITFITIVAVKAWKAFHAYAENLE
jgi:hypothetical protein